MEEIKKILESRNKVYGMFRDNANVAQAIKEIMRSSVSWDICAEDQKEALDLIAMKISRILSGNPHYADSWYDIAGFATLVSQNLTDKVEPLA